MTLDSNSGGVGAHHLKSIMFTDIEGYTALMQRNEQAAVDVRKRHRNIFNVVTAAYGGEILQYYGDGTLSVFDSAIDAVKCGVEMQLALRSEPAIPVRIGIHSGDVLIGEDEIIGDSVNVASRIESLAVAGSVLVSNKVYDEIKNQTDIRTQPMGGFALKNVSAPIDVYAIANEGLVVPKRASLSGKATRVKAHGRNLIFGSVVAVILALALILIWRSGRGVSGVPNDEPVALAVLPFRTIGDDGDENYFADGVREELFVILHSIDSLNIMSRTVADRFDAMQVTNDAARHDLGVTHYVEGKARTEGNRIRISIKLVNATSEEQLWAHSYDREYADIWATQSEIARNVANALQFVITPRAEESLSRQPTDDPEAWDDFLRASYYLRKYINLLSAEGSSAELAEAGANILRYGHSAIRRDTDFALGYAFLGYIYREQDPDSSILLVEKAISLDPTLSTPYYVRAEYRAYNLGDTVGAIRDYEKAIDNGPQMFFPYWHFAQFHSRIGDIPNALKYSFATLDRNPEPWITSQVLISIGWDYLEIGDFERAQYYMDKALVTEPDNLSFMLRKAHLLLLMQEYNELVSLIGNIAEVSPGRAHYELGLYHLMQEQYKESIASFEKYFTTMDKPGFSTGGHMYAFALQKAGRVKEAARWFTALEQYHLENETPSKNYELAKIYSAMGETDTAYKYLQKVVSVPFVRSGLAAFVGIDPMFESIRHQNRFKRIVSQALAGMRAEYEKVNAMEVSGELPEDEVEVLP